MAVGLMAGFAGAAGAAAGLCWACAKPGVARPGIATARAAAAQSAQADRRNVMVVLPLKPDLWPFDHTGAGWSSQDSGLRHADEQAVLDHAGDLRQFLGENGRIGDPLELSVQNPVAAIGD